VIERLKGTDDEALKVLRHWSNRQRTSEIQQELLSRLRAADFHLQNNILRELKRPRTWIRRIDQNSVIIPISITTLDDRRTFSLRGLLDSGATGCYIDKGFVQAKKINLETLPRSIPVYNADGSHNSNGPIQAVAKFRLQIADHVELCNFAVTNTGKADVIIGFDWLRKHNPLIDWRTGNIVLNRCPSSCLPISGSEELEESCINHPGRLRGENVEEGDRIFVTKIEPECQEDEYWRKVEEKMQQDIRAMGTQSQKLAEEALRVKPGASLSGLIPKYLEDFAPVFEKASFDRLPERRRWDHAIELKSETAPFNSKIYPLSLGEQAELDKFIEEHLRTGRIRPSKSPIASPFFFIKKKDGTLRPVQDYRRLNEVTIKNRYPLPLISEVVHKLRKAKYFTKLDIRWGYNNIRLREGDEWKAAFTTNRGLYEPLVMFFGLTNSPATFQTMMNDLLRDLISRGVVIVYMDDILIFTESREEHRKVTREVLQILQDNHLYLKPEKCAFEQTEIEYLGLLIRHGQVSMDPIKVKGVQDWPRPTSKRELQQFLGFVNYYRRFIQGFANIAHCLHRLTGNEPWHWAAPEEEAFQKLKIATTSAPVLSMPNDDQSFRLEADSSNYATGAVLSQIQDDGKWHPIAFISRSLNDVERNYDIYDKEMLAVMRALQEWRHYLMGAKHTFEILTDHKNLEYFRSAKNLNRRQARWALQLAEYDFILTHKPGRLHGKPDALSRRADHGRGESDNQDRILLRPEWFRAMAVETTLPGDELLERIRKSKKLENEVIQSRKTVAEEWEEQNGLHLWKNRIYVPNDKRLREEIIHSHHDSPSAGHPGRFKTTELILRTYWWPRIHAHVAAYVRGCEKCQRTKTFPTKPSGLLAPNLVPEANWQVISADLITQLPQSQGYDAILVVVDRLSKMIRLVPTNGELTSEGLARLYRDRVWKDFGLPERILSDRGTQFASNFMRDLNRLLGIQANPSTAYHPQTDGQTERINQEIEQYLRLFVNYRQDDWAEWLALAEFSYNDKIQSSTGYSPFFLNYGRHPRKDSEPHSVVQTESAEVFASRMNSLTKDAATALTRAAEDMKKYYDKYRSEAPDYQPGDLVYLEGTNLKSDRPARKLDDRRFGPFKILKKVGERAYKLHLPRSWKKIHPVFHTILLRPYHPPTSPLQQKPPPPPPIDVKGALEHEVEEVVACRKRRGRTEYLVKWKGQPREESTWEPQKNLSDEFGTNEALKRYWNQADIRELGEKSRNEFAFTTKSQAVYDWKRRGFRWLTREGIRDIRWDLVGEDTDLERGVLS
jgi:hypothetical protein